MNVLIAGIKLDVGDVVWIFDLWRATPVYHRADFKFFPNGEGAILRTACGIAVNGDDRGDGRRTADGLPPKHATKFSRPCATCWPELRAQTSLFTRRGDPAATPRQEALIHGNA